MEELNSMAIAEAKEEQIAPATATANPTALAFTPESHKMLMSMASLYSRSAIVPQAYRNKPEDCYIACSMALRMGIDPMMVMQSAYVVQGNLSWSGQSCFALIECCGKFKNLRYEETFNEKTKEFSCRLVAEDKRTGKIAYGETVDTEMIKAMGWADKPNSYWLKMPRQMARYRSAAFFARAFCPEALMGLYTADEQRDITKNYEED